MGFVSQYVIHTIVEEHHPALNSEFCVNRKQKRIPCTVCKDVCSQDVFQQVRGEPPLWSKCIACNLCVSACPGRCITASTDTLKPYLTGYDDSGLIKIGCTSTEETMKIQEYCVASVPWEFIAYLALRMRIHLYLPCEECGDEKAKELVESHIENLKHFLGEKLFASRIALIRSDADIPPQDRPDRAVSRNELFGMMKRQVTSKAFKAIAEVNVDDYDGMFYRRLLGDITKTCYDQAKEKGNKTSFGVKLPHFTQKCYTCDTCARLCPQKAISFGEVKDGKRGIYITPWKCTGCGICETLCREHGIDEMKWMQVPHMNKLLLTKVNVRTCEVCGKPLKMDTKGDLCVFCKTKTNMQKRKDTAAQSAEEKKAAESKAAEVKTAEAAEVEETSAEVKATEAAAVEETCIGEKATEAKTE